jgi:hypothetical protein
MAHGSLLMWCIVQSRTCNGGGWVLYGAILRGDSMWTEWLDQLQVPFIVGLHIWGMKFGACPDLWHEFPFPQLGWSLGLVSLKHLMLHDASNIDSSMSWAFSGETLRAALDTSKLFRFCYWEHWCRKIATEQMPKTERERDAQNWASLPKSWIDRMSTSWSYRTTEAAFIWLT